MGGGAKALLNKEAFTLIELLAVIVILAIIALIATPQIMNVINEAKKGAFKSSVYGIIKAAEQGYSQALIKTSDVEATEYEYVNGNKNLKQGNIEINYKGSSPKRGTILINNQGQVAVALYQDGYCITKSYNESDIQVDKKEECNIRINGYDETKGVNEPVIVSGMTPIKWNGNNWVTTTTNDNDWYDYNNKRWANVATIDKTRAIDYSNNGYYGMINGASQVSEGIKFDGIDDYIEADSRLQNYNFENTISIVARFRKNDSNGSLSRIIGNWQTGGGGISINSSGYIYGDLYIDGAYRSVNSNVIATEGTFYTVVLTYNGTNLSIYINGSLSKSVSITGGIGLSTVSMGIGVNINYAGHDGYLNGTISHAMVYNRILAASEISSNYSSIPTLNTTNLLLGYDFTKTSVESNVVLSDSNINTMWVWIPRYAYKITSNYHSTTAGVIDVKFLKGTSNITQDKTKIETSGYNVETKNTSTNYFLHPAFNFDGDALGYWVAKYEPTAAEGVVSGVDSCNSADNVSTKTVKIVPNATSWRCINHKNSYIVSLNMKDKTDVYGWNASEVDTHLMKNSEWGAVAYLSKSQYGANTLEVWNNSYNQYKTGCSGSSVSAVNEAICVEYNTENGVKASTTHNIYGIYDMSGGAHERTMAVYNNLQVSSGFTANELETLNSKYIDRYTTLTDNLLNGMGMNYDVNIYGDGVYETSNNAYRYDGSVWSGNSSGWYGDATYLPYASSPWFIRSGYFSNASDAGVFRFSYTPGDAYFRHSFRPVVFTK